MRWPPGLRPLLWRHCRCCQVGCPWRFLLPCESSLPACAAAMRCHSMCPLAATPTEFQLRTAGPWQQLLVRSARDLNSTGHA